MTDKEIIQALEYCAKRECQNCARIDSVITQECDCRLDLIEISTNLINRQQAEINQLRLSYILESPLERISSVRAEAIKEFAERLKKHCRKMEPSDFSSDFWDYAVLVSDVDKLVNEMVSEN